MSLFFPARRSFRVRRATISQNENPKSKILPLALALLAAGLLPRLAADPLSREFEVDFGREVPSRNLQGLATRSDARVLPGPVFTDLAGPRIADILWTLRPAGPGKFLIGTGPDGEVHEVTFHAADATTTTRLVADVEETQAMAVLPLADGGLLVGTSPTAALYLFRAGAAVARVPLPADSVFDLLALPDGSVLAATGNPGRIYRLDPARFATAGLQAGRATDDSALAAAGLTRFAEVRDRNLRRLARLTDGRIVAGSAPKGNLYAFAPTGGAPAILQENRDSEVVDLLATDDGGFYAALVSSPGDTPRLNRPRPAAPAEAAGATNVAPSAAPPTPSAPSLPEPPVATTFAGRSTLWRFPADGYPESVAARSAVALYRIAPHGDQLILTGGENGDTFGYDPAVRRSLVFPGSASAQLNDLAPLDAHRFLVLRNNAPGLGLLAFAAPTPRELETKRLDLGTPADFGLLRLPQLRGLDPASVKVAARVNLSSDELEGWSDWADLPLRDGGYSAEGLRGRYLKLRLTLPAEAADFQFGKAVLYYLPQNLRPQLADFRFLPPNLGLVPAPEPGANATASLSQLLFPGQRDPKAEETEKRKNALLNSQVVPQPGARLAYWAVTDPNGDNLAYTLSFRPESADTWTDLAVDTTATYLQFDTGALAEGLYLTRLTVTEQAPRPAAQRLTYTFETDALRVDRTPPVITTATAARREGRWFVTVSGRDDLSLLAGAEFAFNNGARAAVEQPDDGILDGQTESFTAELPETALVGATSVEILLHDQAGNHTPRRLPLR